MTACASGIGFSKCLASACLETDFITAKRREGRYHLPVVGEVAERTLRDLHHTRWLEL